METYTAIGITAANLALWLVVAVRKWVSDGRWRATVEREEVGKIAAERDALRLEVQQLKLTASAATAVGEQCRSHLGEAYSERDVLARKLAGLKEDE